MRIAALIIFFAASPAFAQVLQQTSCAIPGSDNSTETATTDGDVEATFTAYSDPCNFLDTTPLNAAQCTTPTAFTIEWQISDAAYGSNGQFEIFPASQDNDCANYIVPSASDYFYNGIVSGVPQAQPEFPGGSDLNGNVMNAQNGLSLDTKAIMQAADCCNASGATNTACDGVVFDLCVAVVNNGTSPATVYSAYMQFYVDTVPPPAPTSVSVTAGDERVIVTWAAESTLVQNYYVKVYNPDGSLNQTVTVASTAGLTATANNLSNDTAYTVTVSAEDYGNNTGAESAPVSVTPRDQCDAWECYGGKEKGGFCFVSTAAYGSYDAGVVQVFRDFRDEALMKFSWGRAFVLGYYKHGVRPAVWLAQHSWARRAAAAALLPFGMAAALAVRAGPATVLLLCALAILFFLVMRRYAFLLVLFFIPLTAHAQDSGFPDETDPSMSMPLDHDFTEPENTEPRDPLPRVGLALKLGTYRPRIDSDPLTNGWYADYFGASSPAVTGPGRKLLIFAEGDIYILRAFGLLGVSGGVGWWQANGKSIVCNDSSGNPVSCTPQTFRQGAPGTEPTSFTMIPISLSVVYKLDVFLERWHVPLVPYARAGLDCYAWWITGSGRQAVKANWMGGKNVQGLGATFGAHLRPGLAIDLGWADPGKVMESIHITHSALTFEWVIDRIDNFGSPHSWDLSDSSFLAGIEVEI